MLSEIAQTARVKTHQLIGRFQDKGDTIWEEDWEILVVLDACRGDTMETVAPEYGFISSIERRWSVGGMTPEWMDNTFNFDYSDQMEETGIIVGNPFSRNHINGEHVLFLDEVWRYAWDDDVGTVRPDAITDRAITKFRSEEIPRMIVHYMQPHTPFIEFEHGTRLSKENFSRKRDGTPDEWDLVTAGELSEDAAREAYRDNLRLVLNSVQTLLNNINAEEVAITADHGELIGELGIYGHSKHIQHRALRSVPWIKSEAEDRGGYQPVLRDRDEDDALKQKLHDLGYR